MERTYRRPERTSGQVSLLSSGDQAEDRSSTQAIVRRKRSRNTRRTVESLVEWQDQLWFDTWFVEIGFLIISIACFVAIGIVLSIFDGKNAPTLPSGLTMNAIIAVVSAASKSALVLVVASSIGQLKWVWYRQNRRLDDVQLFEDASRGPFGSFQLLWRHRGVSFASIGAALIVLASLFEPFTQQILTFVPETVEVNSTLAVARQARLALIDENFNEFYRATQAGIWTSNFQRQLSCPTGNCTWETFPSLSMCSKCGVPETPPKLESCTWELPNPPANLTEILPDASYAFLGRMTPVDTVSCNITFVDGFPSQLSVDVYYGCPNGSDGIDNPSSDNCSYQVMYPEWATVFTDFDNADDPRASGFPTNQSLLGVPNPMMVLGKTEFYLDDSLTSLHINVSTSEICILNYCLQDYTISMENGQHIVDVSNTRYGDTYYNLDGFLGQNASSYPYYCWAAEGETFVWNDSNEAQVNESYGNMVLSDSEHFSFCNLGWFRGISSDIGESLAGNNTYGSQYVCQDGLSHCELVNSLFFSLEGQSGQGVQQIMDNNMTYVMNNLASSLTQFLGNTNTTPIYGKVQHRVTRVNVRWVWLVLPGVLVLAGGIFLLMTIITTNRSGAPIWKNSVLALLFTGLEDDELKETTTTGRVSTMHQQAKDMTLGLKADDRDARMVFGRSGETRELRSMPYQSHSATTTSSQIYEPVQPRSVFHDG